MRRKVTNRNVVTPESTYNSYEVAKLINYIMERGKKNAARKIVYDALDLVKEMEGKEPMDVFTEAIKNTSPLMEVRSRRVGGANYQVPREVRPERRLMLSMRWIKEAAASKKGEAMHKKLAKELIAASKNEGTAVKKREDTHKMAEANKAFAHFAW
ncbi:MAG: 30S ribosomal protein S7 [Minisyncoccia bacterium]